MTIRLQEVHPSVVHMPIAFLPLSIVADIAGKVTGNRTLLSVGKWGMALTVGSAVLAGITGLIAQEEVRAEGRARDLLVTHRNINLGAATAATVMMIRRFRRKSPSLGYLAAGLGAIGAVVYSAYLGGKMVYDHGVGVRAADGIQPGHAPELKLDEVRDWARHSAGEVARGARRAAREIAGGDIAPALTRRAA